MNDFWKADLHIHSTSSLCSSAPLLEIVTFAGDQFNLFSVTDHDLPSPHSPYLSESYLAQFFDVKFIPGVEVTTREGHLLILNFSGEIPPFQPVKSVFQQLKGKDVITIAPHPFRWIGLGELIYDLPLDAIEINGGCSKKENQKAAQAAKEMDIALVGGSDAHRTEDFGRCYFTFPKSYPLSFEGLKEAISDQKTFPKWKRR